MKYSLLVLFLLTSFAAWGQSAEKLIRKGNKAYEKEDYGSAVKNYREAQQKKEDSYAAKLNLGDALYKQKKYEEAAGQFGQAAKTAKDKQELASAYHNLGNSYLKANKLDESIEAYKKALQNNPDDLETKYNLSYALEKKKKQQQQQNKNDQKKNKQDQKNKQDKQQQNKGGNGQKEQDKQNQQNQEEQNQERQPQKGISEKEAERILNSLNNQEQKVRQQLYKDNRKESTSETEKPW